MVTGDWYLEYVSDHENDITQINNARAVRVSPQAIAPPRQHAREENSAPERLRDDHVFKLSKAVDRRVDKRMCLLRHGC